MHLLIIKCKLKKYHGKNFTYKGNDPHQWYLELSFANKEILKNEILKSFEQEVVKIGKDKFNIDEDGYVEFIFK